MKRTCVYCLSHPHICAKKYGTSCEVRLSCRQQASASTLAIGKVSTWDWQAVYCVVACTSARCNNAVISCRSKTPLYVKLRDVLYTIVIWLPTSLTTQQCCETAAAPATEARNVSLGRSSATCVFSSHHNKVWTPTKWNSAR